jgi:hypothetical protein
VPAYHAFLPFVEPGRVGGVGEDLRGRAVDFGAGDEVSRFYTTALPLVGYTINSNTSATGGSFSGTGIWFTGHGYNGQVGALSSFQIPGISLGANTVEITLTPQ